jgi:hypothetical protein
MLLILKANISLLANVLPGYGSKIDLIILQCEALNTFGRNCWHKPNQTFKG